MRFAISVKPVEMPPHRPPYQSHRKSQENNGKSEPAKSQDHPPLHQGCSWNQEDCRPENESKRHGPQLSAHAKDWNKDVFDW
jgi:hypothetical protein